MALVPGRFYEASYGDNEKRERVHHRRINRNHHAIAPIIWCAE